MQVSFLLLTWNSDSIFDVWCKNNLIIFYFLNWCFEATFSRPFNLLPVYVKCLPSFHGKFLYDTQNNVQYLFVNFLANIVDPNIFLLFLLQVWFDNVPHPKLVQYKKEQNWVRKSGDYLVFPGGGTQFKDGVNHYIDYIEKVVFGFFSSIFQLSFKGLKRSIICL